MNRFTRPLMWYEGGRHAVMGCTHCPWSERPPIRAGWPAVERHFEMHVTESHGQTVLRLAA